MTWERPALGTSRGSEETEHRANLPTKRLDAQAIFDKVAAHLAKQGAKSREFEDMGLGSGVCRYRGEEGRSCAVGCLIPDEVYTRYDYDGVRYGCGNRLEYNDVYHSDVLEALNASGIGPEHSSLLKALQEVHDETPVDAWPNNLARVARDYKLTYNHATEEAI